MTWTEVDGSLSALTGTLIPYAPVVNVQSSPYSAKLDFKAVTDAAMTSGSAVLTSASAAFTSADVGKLILVRGAGAANSHSAILGDSNYPLFTTIASFTSGTQVTLATTASNTVSSGLGYGQAIWASDDTTPIQNAINSLRSDMGGSGFGTILIPGVAFTSTSLTINTQYCKPLLTGMNWMQCGIVDLGAAASGAIYVTGPTTSVAGQNYANNGNWFEIRDLTIYSGRDHGVNIDAGLNGRMNHLWISQAGDSSGLAGVRITQSGILEFNNLRIGGGNMYGALGGTGGNAGSLAPWGALLSHFSFPHAIYATNSATSLVTELHCVNVQAHAATNSHAVRLETTAGGVASAFNFAFTDCQIKQSSLAGSTTAAYFLDGVVAQLVNCYSEMSGTAPYADMIRIKGTNGSGTTTISACRADNGNLTFDLSGGATTLTVYLDGISAFAGGAVQSTGSTSTLIVIGDYFNTPAFNAGNFTGNNSMTWTLASGDVTTYKWSLSGKKLLLLWHLITTTVGGTPSTQLRIAIPNGYTAAATYRSTMTYSDAGATKAVGGCFVTAGAAFVSLVKMDGSNWSAATDTTETYGQMLFEIQ